MRWQQLDKTLRMGAVLVMDGTFGAWVEDGDKLININAKTARAILARDLVVINEKRSRNCYAFRHKYI